MDESNFSAIDSFVMSQHTRNMRELNDTFIRAAKQANMELWEAVCYLGISLEQMATPATIRYAQESLRQRWELVKE